MITKQTILSAHDCIRPYVHKTPVLTSDGFHKLTGCNLYFKCENFQKTGAFKARGAMNAVLSFEKDSLIHGVATHSSGNHAQALSRAARIVGVPAYVVMPSTSAEIKKRAVREYGGKIVECEPTLQSRESTLVEVIQKTKAVEIHPFNNDEVITGQATTAKELLEEVPDLHYIIAPVGGGGLLSGTLLATKFFSPNVHVIGAEPAGADDAFRSLQSGSIKPSQANSIADGLLATLSDKTFTIIREHVKEIITVTDQEIVAAMRLIWERMKIIVEPSCAVPLAAVLKEKKKFQGKKVGIILSGGNVDLERVGKLFGS